MDVDLLYTAKPEQLGTFKVMKMCVTKKYSANNIIHRYPPQTNQFTHTERQTHQETETETETHQDTHTGIFFVEEENFRNCRAEFGPPSILSTALHILNAQEGKDVYYELGFKNLMIIECWFVGMGSTELTSWAHQH